MLPGMCTTTRVAKKPRQLFLYPRPKFFTFFANRMTTFRNGRLQGRCAAVLPRQDRRARGSLCKFPGSMRSVISNPDTVYMLTKDGSFLHSGSRWGESVIIFYFFPNPDPGTDRNDKSIPERFYWEGALLIHFFILLPHYRSRNMYCTIPNHY